MNRKQAKFCLVVQKVDVTKLESMELDLITTGWNLANIFTKKNCMLILKH